MSENNRDGADMAPLGGSQGENPSPREEIEMLLPWFVTGQLDSVEAERVELYLEQHPEVSAQLGLVRDEMDVSITEAEKLGSPRAGHLNTLMREIEADGTSRSSAMSGIFTKVSNWLGGFEPRQVGFAAMAALALIVAQGITIGGLMRSGGTDAPAYETASGPNETVHGAGTKLLIIFNSAARASDIEKLLSKINGSIVSGPKAGGYYQISIGSKAMAEDQLEALLIELKGRKDVFSFVARSGN